jgi:hypothetical protein
MSTFLFQVSVLFGLATYPVFEGDRFSTGFFETMVLLLLFAGPFLVLLSLRHIAKLLAAILDEMTGETKAIEDKASFYDRPSKGRE